MDISRILRVLLTIFLVATFVVVTVAAYRQNQKVKSMTRLSDATTSLAVGLTSQELAWEDDGGTRHPFVLDVDKLDNLEGRYQLPEENLAFRATIICLEDNYERKISGVFENLPKDKMSCSLSFPASLRSGGRVMPAKLKVISWFA